MLYLNGVFAWIEVDGKELEQYGVEEDPDQRRVTCWIPTQVGKSFSVAFKDNSASREHSLCTSMRIDGSFIPGVVLFPSAMRAKRTVYQREQPVTATSSRPFLFSKLELTDQDEYLNQASQYLGEIQMSIYKIEVLGTRVYEPLQEVPGHGKIHERSKKAVTQCVSYGPELKKEPLSVCTPRFLDNGASLVTFVFKYRDLGFLQAAGIAPRAPTTKKRSIATGDVLDLSTGVDVKSESDDQEIKIIDEVRPVKRIKREKKFVPAGEVIDLT